MNLWSRRRVDDGHLHAVLAKLVQPFLAFGPRSVTRSRINVTGTRDLDQAAAPAAREELGAFYRDERVISAGHHD